METKQRLTKVKVNFTLDVDIDSWNQDNGTETVTEVRQDVKEYVRNLLQQCSAAEYNCWTVTG